MVCAARGRLREKWHGAVARDLARGRLRESWHEVNYLVEGLIEKLSIKREEAGRMNPVGQSIMKKVLLALALYMT